MTLLTTSPRDIDHLENLIRGIRIAMMTTVCKDGSLCSRPMATQEPHFDGGLWFFTKADSAKVVKLKRRARST
ncbi:MAG: pyridoxamine 5'-phosphate oxidase family protein [Planctomycetaceae bacterium]